MWWKAKIFDAELKNLGHISGSKMVNFIMDQRSKMDASLKAMKAVIASCTKLFPVVVESSEKEESSSSYSDLTPHDIEEIQDATKEVDQQEDITAITDLYVFTTNMVVSNATPVSAKVGEKIQENSHMATVTPPSLAMAFQVLAATCNTCSGISAGQPTVRTTVTGRFGGGGPRGSHSRTRWTRGVSSTTTWFIFGNGHS